MSTASFVFIFIGFAGTLLGVMAAFFYNKYTHAVNQLEQFKKQQKPIAQKEAVVVQKAEQQAITIVEEASARARDILAQVQLLDTHVTKTLDESAAKVVHEELEALKQQTQMFLSSYQTKLDQLKQTNVTSFERVSKEFEQSALSEVEDFKKILQQETVESQKLIEARIEEAYKKAEADVSMYKNQQLAHINDRIYEVLFYVTRIILGNGLNLQEQQNLVIQALEEAKKQNKLL